MANLKCRGRMFTAREVLIRCGAVKAGCSGTQEWRTERRKLVKLIIKQQKGSGSGLGESAWSAV